MVRQVDDAGRHTVTSTNGMLKAEPSLPWSTTTGTTFAPAAAAPGSATGAFEGVGAAVPVSAGMLLPALSPPPPPHADSATSRATPAQRAMVRNARIISSPAHRS